MAKTAKRLPLLVALALALCLCPALAFGAENALTPSTGPQDKSAAPGASLAIQAKGGNILGKANTKQVFYYGYKNGKQYKSWSKTVSRYDVTGDKTADTVKVVLTPHPTASPATIKLRLYVNDKLMKTINSKTGGLLADVRVVTLKNNKPFIYVRYTGNNGDGTYELYQIKKGKLKTVISNKQVAKTGTNHNRIDSLKPVENKVKVTFGSMMYSTGGTQIKFTYKYKSGTLKRTSNSSKAISYMKRGSYKYKKYSPLTAAMSFKVYKNMKAKKVAFTVHSGDSVKPIAIGYKGKRAFLKVKVNGKTGWAKVAKVPYGKTSSGTYFYECFLAG